jgi:hypothetical protein
MLTDCRAKLARTSAASSISTSMVWQPSSIIIGLGGVGIGSSITFSTGVASLSGVGDRLVYLHTELNLVRFLPFPAIVPSSSAKGSSSNKDPYEVLARLTNAGDEKMPSSSFFADSEWSIPLVPFVPFVGKMNSGIASGSIEAIGSSDSAGGWSRSMVTES